MAASILVDSHTVKADSSPLFWWEDFVAASGLQMFKIILIFFLKTLKTLIRLQFDFFRLFKND
jgi:hypothetical protein